jgi:hypothetical protein
VTLEPAKKKNQYCTSLSLFLLPIGRVAFKTGLDGLIPKTNENCT